MINLYLVRNAETNKNIDSKLQGHTESYLSRIGIKQAIKLDVYLKNIDFVEVYCSPLNRAVETYENSKITNPCIYLDMLKERNFGSFNNMKYNSIINKHPSFRPKDGESLIDILNRAQSFLKFIQNKNFEQENINILVFSHHELILSCVCYALKLDINNFRNMTLSNASITWLTYKNAEWKVKTLNEISHIWNLDTTKEFD